MRGKRTPGCLAGGKKTQSIHVVYLYTTVIRCIKSPLPLLFARLELYSIHVNSMGLLLGPHSTKCVTGRTKFSYGSYLPTKIPQFISPHKQKSHFKSPFIKSPTCVSSLPLGFISQSNSCS